LCEFDPAIAPEIAQRVRVVRNDPDPDGRRRLDVAALRDAIFAPPAVDPTPFRTLLAGTGAMH
jgi:hypothetical protein